MATRFLVWCVLLLFSTTHSQLCNSFPGQSFLLSSSSPSTNQPCSLKLPISVDSSILQSCGNCDVFSGVTSTSSRCQVSKPCISNVGSSCSCNDNSVFIPCETPIILNADIPNGITVSNLGSETRISGNSVSCANQNRALNSAALNPASLNLISASNQLPACASQVTNLPLTSGSVTVSGVNLNVLDNSNFNCLSGPSKSNVNIQEYLQPACQGNPKVLVNNLNLQPLSSQICDITSNVPSNSLQNSQTLLVANFIDNNPCLSSTSQSIVSNSKPTCMTNQLTSITPQITSIPTVSLPITSCANEINIPSSSSIISCSNTPSANFISSLPSNPFTPPCIKVPNINSIVSNSFPSLNSPCTSSNLINTPCGTINSNTQVNNLVSCTNSPTILNSPCIRSNLDLNDDYLITQSTSPCAKPFPNVQSITPIESSCNSVVTTSLNCNTPNIQTVTAVPCGCSKLSSVACPQNAIPCQCSRLPTSVSLNQLAPVNSLSFDNNYNLRTVQTNSVKNCNTPKNVVKLPFVLNDRPSVSCTRNTPSVLPQVITPSIIDSAKPQCNSLTSSIIQPRVVTTTSPPIIPSTTSPVVAATIIDNTVSNSLANAIQLLIVSNLIQSLNQPTLPVSNAASVNTITNSAASSQVSNSIGVGGDLASVNTATSTSTSTNTIVPDVQAQNYGNPYYNGYQEPYYPNLYDIVAQKFLEEYPINGPLAPIASRILGLPDINLPNDNNYYDSPYDNNFGQNTFYGTPDSNYFGPNAGPNINGLPDFYPGPNGDGFPNDYPNFNNYLGSNNFPGPIPNGIPNFYPDPNFFVPPNPYPDPNLYAAPNAYSDPNFYGVPDNYPEAFYGVPNLDRYPDTNNYYAVPDVYPDSSNFYEVPETYSDVNNNYYYEVPDSYDLPTSDDSLNYYAVPEVNTAVPNAYIINEEAINSVGPSYTVEIIPENSIANSIYLLPESIPISNPTYSYEPVSIPTYNFLESCPSLSVKSPAEVYLPSNVYSATSFTPPPFYIDQRETANPFSAVTPVAAEILIPSEFRANLICDLAYVPSSLPVVNVATPMFEIEPDFSKLYGCYC